MANVVMIIATAEILGPSVGAFGSTVLKVHPILPSLVKVDEIGQGQLWLLCGFCLRSGVCRSGT